MSLFPAILCASVLIAAGCGNQTVRFSESWPTAHPEGDTASLYEETTEAWTRRGTLRAGTRDLGSQLLEVHATFLAPQWRQASWARQCDVQRLGASSKEALQKEHQEKLATSYQAKLIVTTYYPEHNELHRESSIWRIVLLDERGTEVEASLIEKDRRPREIIKAEFPHFGDFSQAYLVTFPKTTALLRGKRFALRLSSTLGVVDLEWIAAK